MRRWSPWHTLRYCVLVALLFGSALPPVVARAADDPATAATAQLPAGYTVTYTQVVDLGGDGRLQAIIKADAPSGPTVLPAQIVGVLVQKGGTWQLVSQTMPFPETGTQADIYAYPKNSQHPGFVITNQHICGANCNAGTYALMRYDNGAFITAISGVNDRGHLSADPDTTAVTLDGPVYTHADPRCCPPYRYTRTFTWQGNNLVQRDIAFTPAPEQTVPAWFTSDGSVLVTSLSGFIAEPAIGAPVTPAYIAAIFSETVTVKDAANTTCIASGKAIAAALAGGITRGGGAVWPTADGYNLALRWTNGAAPDGIAADACTLDAGADGGYVLHLIRISDRFIGDTLSATPQIANATPADAIQLPPV